MIVFLMTTDRSFFGHLTQILLGYGLLESINFHLIVAIISASTATPSFRELPEIIAKTQPKNLALSLPIAFLIEVYIGGHKIKFSRIEHIAQLQGNIPFLVQHPFFHRKISEIHGADRPLSHNLWR